MRMMITYDPDPDVVRWGLHHIDVCAIPYVGPYTVTQFEPDRSQVGYIREGYDEPVSVTQYERDQSQLAYIREGYNEVVYTNVDNDEVIARALQEELSLVTAAEASGVYDPVQASVLEQSWLSRPEGNDSSRCSDENIQLPGGSQIGGHMTQGGECSEKKEENEAYTQRPTENYGPIQNSTPSTSGVETSNTSENLFDDSSDTVDQFALDGEVGKRLNDMVPIPHVPKINGDILPSPDEEMSDHQRLLKRLQVYDLVENKVQGDGNCQFRSISDQLYRSTEYHKFVREQIVNQLKHCPDLYSGYVTMGYDEYLNKMTKNGEWGDHVTLQAAADWFGVKIFVITSFKDTCYIEILPITLKSERVFYLSFWAEVHYNSIYPDGGLDMPSAETRKKKWWKL